MKTLENLSLGESVLVKALQQFKDGDFLLQEGERILVKNALGNEMTFFIWRIGGMPGFVVISTQDKALYPTPEPSDFLKKIQAAFLDNTEYFEGMMKVTALYQREFRTRTLRAHAGETLSVSGREGKGLLKVFKILPGGLLIMADPEKKPNVSLTDRMMVAWEAFTGRLWK